LARTSGKEAERALLKLAPFLHHKTLPKIIANGVEPSDRQCAEKLERILDKEFIRGPLAPVVESIEAQAIRKAGRKIVGLDGRINGKSTYAPMLLPFIAQISLSAFMRLKLYRVFTTAKERFLNPKR
jgi:hypothetical protein